MTPARLCAVAFGVLAAVVLSSAPAVAQESDTPPPGTVVLGPLRVTPSLRLADIGVDNNVFNEPVDPKTDFTFTLTPRADVGFRMSRLRIGYTTQTDYVYYRKYASERGTNFTSAVRLDYDLGQLRPYVSAQGVSTRARLNSEVDARARHHDVVYAAGLAVQVASRTRLLANTSRATTAFDADETFRGVELRRSFDSRRQSVDGGVAIDLTPVTRFSLLVAREQQRFALVDDRDSNTWRISPTLSFSPDGLVRGSATVGYRRFHTLSPDLADYAGLVSSVSVAATLYGRHDVLGTVNRDVQYSYDENTDYYVGTTAGVTWTMLLAGPFDVRGTVSRTLMDYRDAAGIAGNDTMRTVGGGFGVRFKGHARLGLNADWSRRASGRSAERNFRNHRIFAGLTWGTT